MPVLTGDKTAESMARQLLSPMCAASLRRSLSALQWVPKARATVRLGRPGPGGDRPRARSRRRLDTPREGSAPGRAVPSRVSGGG